MPVYRLPTRRRLALQVRSRQVDGVVGHREHFRSLRRKRRRDRDTQDACVGVRNRLDTTDVCTFGRKRGSHHSQCESRLPNLFPLDRMQRCGSMNIVSSI